MKAERRALSPSCVAAFSRLRGYSDPASKCGLRARYDVNGEPLCKRHARQRCAALGIELPPHRVGW